MECQNNYWYRLGKNYLTFLINHVFEKVPGKIVVFNEDFISYGETVQYRGQGATEASKYGAVAALIRSVSGFSLNTPHTGMMSYGSDKRIPAACITIEDAQMLHRLQKRGI